MAIYEILKVGDPVLREISRPVPEVTQNILKLLDNMSETMYHADGVGLAAPQIGITKRVVVIDAGDGLIELINPEILETKGEDIDTEGCLSIPGLNGKVGRAFYAKIKALDRSGKEIILEGTDLLARAFQHEIDHLDGILFVDKLIKEK